MAEKKNHWTAASTGKFLYRIASDFIRQIEQRMEREGVKQGELAAGLGVTEGRVSQIINNPGNLTLKNVVQYARALGMKVAIVAYDDGDTDNERGPIHGEIFSACWEHCQKPADFFAIEELTARRIAATTAQFVRIPNGLFYIPNGGAEPVVNTAINEPEIFRQSRENPDADKKFKDWRENNQEGYFLMFARDLGAGRVRLHRARCPHIKNQNYDMNLTLNEKMCMLDRDKLVEWARRKLNTEPVNCKSCKL